MSLRPSSQQRVILDRRCFAPLFVTESTSKVGTFEAAMYTGLSADQIKRFNTWKQAKDFLNSLKGRCVFRGVSDAKWDLETSLDRCARYHHAEAESILIESFERSLPTVKTSLPPTADRVSWMALMRHYGLPSRLLDCTECISVAAYFAVAAGPKSDFAIWAFDIGTIRRSAEKSLGILSVANVPLSPLELGTRSEEHT